jgi:hypothetical protein
MCLRKEIFRRIILLGNQPSAVLTRLARPGAAPPRRRPRPLTPFLIRTLHCLAELATPFYVEELSALITAVKPPGFIESQLPVVSDLGSSSRRDRARANAIPSGMASLTRMIPFFRFRTILPSQPMIPPTITKTPRSMAMSSSRMSLGRAKLYSRVSVDFS